MLTEQDAAIERRVRFRMCRDRGWLNYCLWHCFLETSFKDYALMVRLSRCKARTPIAKRVELKFRRGDTRYYVGVKI